MRKKHISKKTTVHSSKGDFIYPKEYFPRKILTMKSGGHGQENISFLKKKKMSFGIDTEFNNGVRLGHVDRHRRKRDTCENGHAWFPSDWKHGDIKKAGQYIASLKRNQKMLDGKQYSGRYRGVSVGIISRQGRIKTVYLLYDVNKHARKRTQIKHK